MYLWPTHKNIQTEKWVDIRVDNKKQIDTTVCIRFRFFVFLLISFLYFSLTIPLSLRWIVREEGFPYTESLRPLPHISLMRLGVSVVVGFGDVVGGDEATTKTCINLPQLICSYKRLFPNNNYFICNSLQFISYHFFLLLNLEKSLLR